MRAITKTMIVAFVAATLGGCIVHTHNSSRRQAVRRDCPPAHHWDGYACVHNGKAKGHYK